MMKVAFLSICCLLLGNYLWAQQVEDLYLYVGTETDWNLVSETWDIEQVPIATRARFVRSQLPQQHKEPLDQLVNQLLHMPDVTVVQRYWIAPVIRVQALPSAIPQLRNLSLIEEILPVPDLIPDDEQTPMLAVPVPGGREPAHDVIGATSLWQQGYTGYGRKVYIIDSGVDPEHPALSTQFAGNYTTAAQTWYEPGGSVDPRACGSHGTLVAGVILGLDRNLADTTGVAPEALWMAAPPAADGPPCVDVDILAALQWALDPDGDSTTVSDIPDVINNSWSINLGGPASECTGPYRDAMAALEAAGIAVIFSAGNTGPGTQSIPAPKNININPVNVFCVGSINGNNPAYSIASSSARGPSACGGPQDSIKPEVVAPGVQIRTTGPGDAYFFVSGTSFAAPQAAGAALLLKDVFPAASGKKILESLYYSASDLGDPGPDNTYGNGLINLPAALSWLQNQGFTPRVPNDSNDVAITDFFPDDQISCDSIVYPLLSLRNAGPNAILSMEAVIDHNGDLDTLSWTGSIPPGGNAFWGFPADSLEPGVSLFSITIISVNGATDQRYLDNRISGTVTRLPASQIIIELPELCQGGYVTPDPEEGTYAWYASEISHAPEVVGDRVLLGPFFQDSSVFVARRHEEVGGKSNQNDPGDYQTDFAYLYFDAEVPFTLKSVTVYSQGDGNRRILLHESDGTILLDTVIFLNFGERNINLEVEVPAGKQLELGIESQFTRLLTTTSGVQYPYSIPNVMAVTGSSLGSDAYPYFYDWVLEYEFCREEVFVQVSNEVLNLEISPSDTALYLASGGGISLSSHPSGLDSVIWAFGNGETGTGDMVSVVYDSAAVYAVFATGTTASGCSNTATARVSVLDWALSSETDFDWGLSISPNPVEDDLHISWTSLPARDLTMKLYTLQGLLVHAQELDPGSGSWILDLSHLPAGAYFLQFDSGKNRTSRRIQLNP